MIGSQHFMQTKMLGITYTGWGWRIMCPELNPFDGAERKLNLANRGQCVVC